MLVTWLKARLGMTSSVGAQGERIAAAYLRSQKYRIMRRNLRTRLGEIDLLAQDPDGRTIVIVEVKTHEGPTPPGLEPENRVNLTKQHKLAALANHVVRRYGLADRPVRFDVIGVDLLGTGKHTLRHHRGAFESWF